MGKPVVVTCGDYRITDKIINHIFQKLGLENNGFFRLAMPGGPSRLVVTQGDFLTYIKDIATYITLGADRMILIAHGGICKWALLNGLYRADVLPEEEKNIQDEELKKARKSCEHYFDKKITTHYIEGEDLKTHPCLICTDKG